MGTILVVLAVLGAIGGVVLLCVWGRKLFLRFDAHQATAGARLRCRVRELDRQIKTVYDERDRVVEEAKAEMVRLGAYVPDEGTRWVAMRGGPISASKSAQETAMIKAGPLETERSRLREDWWFYRLEDATSRYGARAIDKIKDASGRRANRSGTGVL